jgi:hypothetical protein
MQLARDLGWSLQMVGELITGEEFGKWEVMYAKEGWGSANARLRHAQLVVSTLQGPSTRRDGQPWEASHVAGAIDPWAPVAPPRAAKPTKRMSIAQQARAMNAAQRRL